MLGLRCDESVVTLLVLRCYGFGTVLDFFRWLVSRRESSGPASRSRVARTGRESRSTRESERENADAPRLLNCPVLDTAHRRLVESECLYGVEPCPCDIPSLHFHVTKNKLLPMY